MKTPHTVLLECNHLSSTLQEDGISWFKACHLHWHLGKLSAGPGAQHTMHAANYYREVGGGVCAPIYPIKSHSLAICCYCHPEIYYWVALTAFLVNFRRI